jgi:uncharacterized RDD family membrane protein YckC
VWLSEATPLRERSTSCSSRAQKVLRFSSQRLEIMSLNPPNTGLPFESSADKLTIQTPEQTALDFAVAGIGSRFLAIAYDVLIQFLVGLAVGILGAIALGVVFAGAPRAGMWVGSFLLLFYFVLYFGYYAIFEIWWNGQTPGKRKVGIRVIKDDGRPLTPAESIGRNLMRIVDWLPFFYGVGVVCAFLTKGHKRLGDLVVGSLVVRETSLRELKPIWQTSSVSITAPVVIGSRPLGAERLSAAEFALIESFLSRRDSMDGGLRWRMADEVLRKVHDKLTIPTDQTMSAEKILEALSYERRATGRYS